MNSHLPETHEYRRVDNIRTNDFVHRWGDDLRVMDAELNILNGRIWLKVDDGGVIKEWDYKPSDEIICKGRSEKR